ncbi:MAG: carboxypeptidase-like regulatory domain-containing protein [Prevotella sp.]|nr:carboxypeptidase-like regulatory domain-containing protein [Prevotella sp.]
MWLKVLLALITTHLSLLTSSAQVLTGQIVDAQSGETVPMASCIYRGHGVAVASDVDGNFQIARHDGWQLTFSAVGYQPQTINVDASTPRNLRITLVSDSHQLGEVTVRSRRSRYSRRNNPAVELMRKVVAARRRTDLGNHDFYQYNKYQKLTLALNDVTSDFLDSTRLGRKQWLLNQVEVCPYNQKLILPISVDETVSQHLYRRNPHDERTIIRGINNQGINDLIQTGDILTTLMRDVFTDINIYDNQIRLLQYPFTSPIGDDAIAFYRYYIEDTIYVDRDLCFHLQFLPNNQQDFGFRGHLYILADSSYQVKRCEMTIPKRSDVNFVENMQITQEFTKLPNGEWVLSVDDMFTELKVASFLTQFAVIRNTRLTDYAFDELPRQLFKGKKKEVRDVNAMMQNDDFWTQYRQVELTRGESSMDAFVHGLEQIKGFNYIIFVAKAFIENFVETGTPHTPSKVDIGPINTMITNNFVDGYRLRLSAQTTANLDSNLFLSGYIARGLDSHKTYYRGDIIWSFNKKEYLPREFPKRTLTLSSTYDVMSPSDKFMHTDKDNVFTAFKWATVDKMMFYNRQSLTFEREEDWGFRTTISLKTEENEGAGNLFFVPLSQSGNRSTWTNWSNPTPSDVAYAATPSQSLRTTELRAELRFAPGETFINTKQRRLPINLDSPVFTLSHTMGFKDFLGGDYAYNFTEASIYKRFWLKSWGKLDCYVKGGIQWNKVPYPLLIMPETNLSYIMQDYTFTTINNMEFLNDRYASAMIFWDMNGKLFNRIPLLRHLKWREWFSVKCLWGSLSDRNNPLLAQNAGDGTLMYFPEGSYVMDSHRPYWEVSAGIHNIFKIVHVEYVRRLNYNELPTAHKHGVRFMIRMTF